MTLQNTLEGSHAARSEGHSVTVRPIGSATREAHEVRAKRGAGDEGAGGSDHRSFGTGQRSRHQTTLAWAL